MCWWCHSVKLNWLTDEHDNCHLLLCAGNYQHDMGGLPLSLNPIIWYYCQWPAINYHLHITAVHVASFSTSHSAEFTYQLYNRFKKTSYQLWKKTTLHPYSCPIFLLTTKLKIVIQNQLCIMHLRLIQPVHCKIIVQPSLWLCITRLSNYLHLG